MRERAVGSEFAGRLPLGVVVAMEREYRLLLGCMQGGEEVDLVCCGGAASGGVMAHRGVLGHQDYVLVQSGIGKVHAALATQLLVWGQQVSGVLSVGVSGGLGAEVGDLLVGRRFAYHDVWCGEPNRFGQVQGLPRYFEGNDALCRRLMRAALGSVSGLFLCGEYFVPGQEAVREMLERFPGAVGVDMESCAVAQVCYLLGVPFAGLRVVSDTPGRCVDHGAQYARFWAEDASRAFGLVADVLSGL